MINTTITIIQPTNEGSIEGRLFSVLNKFINKPITNTMVKHIKYEIEREIFNMVQEKIVDENELNNVYYILQHNIDNKKLLIVDKDHLEIALNQNYKILG